MECLVLLPFGLLLIPVLVYSHGQRQNHKEALQGLAESVDGLSFMGKEVRGVTDGVKVHVDCYTSGSGKNKSTWTRFRLTDPTSLHARNIASEGLFSGMGKLLGGQDVQLGDPPIDSKLLLRGNQEDIVARMDAEARQLVRNAVVRGWEHEDGTWRFRHRGMMTNMMEMKSILSHGFEAVRALRMNGKRGDVLVERALTDPVPGAAARALEVRMSSAEPLSSADEERLIARGGILAVVVAERMGVRGIDILRDALQTSNGDVRFRASLSLAKLGESTVSSRSVLASALKVEHLRPRAIAALEQIGTVDEVPLLTPIADAWMDASRHAAKQAIRAIQGRIRGAGSGQLALADGVGGGLAVAEPEPDAEASRAPRPSRPRQTE